MRTRRLPGALHSALAFVLGTALGACGGKPTAPSPPPAPTRLLVVGSPGSDGVFDPAPMTDGAGGLWMSHSIVRPSPNDAALSQVRTRIASSPDAGASWSDTGVDPNGLADADLHVPDGSGGSAWATWRFEVSRLLYDPHDADPARRWKLIWHRVLAADLGAGDQPIFENSWMGLATAASPTGPWSAERKLITGSGYNAADMDAFIGAPELPMASLHPGLADCYVFSEPGLLARPEGIYLSLQCIAAARSARKIVLLRCDPAFSACDHLGDLLLAGEAAQFSLPGQALDGFAASELVDAGGSTYLLVTPYELPPDTYRGCLVFRVADLAGAVLERRSGVPVLVKRIAGSAGTFNGACGYHAGATGSGVIYGEYFGSGPRFRLFASHVALP
jgi:hypothetical protein